MTAEIIKIDADTEIKVKRYDSGKQQCKIYYAIGKKHGMNTMWWDNGTKRSEGIWKKSNPHGVYIEWYTSGQKWKEGRWKEGKLHGVARWWYENEERKEEVYYISDKVCARIEWDEEGNITKTNFPKPSTIKTCKAKKKIKAEINNPKLK